MGSRSMRRKFIKKGPRIPVTQPLFEETRKGRAGAEYKLEFADGHVVFVPAGKMANPHKQFHKQRELKSITFLGRGREMTREEALELPEAHPLRKIVLEREELRAKRNVEAAQSAVRSSEISNAVSTAERLGINPKKRYNVKYERTLAGMSQDLGIRGVDVSGAEIIEKFDRGLISSVEAQEAHFNMSGPTGIRGVTPKDKDFQRARMRRKKGDGRR